MKKFVKTAVLSVFALGLIGCGKEESKPSKSATDSKFTGALTTTSINSFVEKSNSFASKTITHVLAISPTTANSEKYVAEVKPDGKFDLKVRSGKPYIIVFTAQDGALTGPDMIVGIIKVASNDLDALSVMSPATVAFGNISVDGSTAIASMITSVTDLVSSLGMTSDEASLMGSIDDLALRMSNPYVDSNGVIDALENKDFRMDWHVRADTKISGSAMEMNDIADAFPALVGLGLDWTLGSGYAVYNTSFDNTSYANGSSTLQNGASFSHIGSSVTPSSYSESPFSEYRQWGPDYNLATGELGGSDGVATFVYTLGTSGKNLTFTNVKTRTRTELNDDGVLLPLVKLNTASGVFTGIGYKWVKRSGSSWVDALPGEVKVIVQADSANLTLYTEKTSSIQKGISFSIPTTAATGTINIGGNGFTNNGVPNLSSLSLDDFCSAALSYDDQIGMRLFAGAPVANTGVSACN